MAVTDQSADFVYSSRSRSPEQLQKDLEQMGYDKVSVNVEGDDKPVPEDVKPAAEAGTEVVSEEQPAAGSGEEKPLVAEEEKPAEAGEKPEEKAAEKPADKPKEAAEEKPAEKSAEAAEEAKPESEAEPEQRKPRNSRERKIQKLEIQLEVDRLERERLSRELAELRARGTEAKPAKEEAKPAAVEKPVAAEEALPALPDPTPRPKHADFFDAEDPVEAFTLAVVEWDANERERKRREHSTLERAKADSRKRQEEELTRQETESAREKAEKDALEDWRKREAAVRARKDEFPDYDQVLNTPGDLCSPVMHRVAYHSDVGPEIKYWLGKHPDQAAKFCADTQLPASFTPVEYDRAYRLATRFLSKIEDEIEAERAKKPAKPAAAQLPEDDDEEEEDDGGLPVAADKKPAAAAKPPADTPAKPELVKKEPAAAPAKTPPTPPPSAAPLKAVPKKHTPLEPVGSRGGSIQKSVTEMDPKTLREMSQDEFRKMRGM